MSEHLRFVRVDLERWDGDPIAASVRAVYEERFGNPPAEPGGWYHPADWWRVAYVLGRLRPTGPFLDVGIGAGQFLNMVARQGGRSTVVGVDRTRFKKLILLDESIRIERASIDALPFADGEFEVVTCMEVLEHLPAEVYEPGLAELRRVCRGQLLMTVPYREPEPISATHVRRFEDADLVHRFPEAAFTLLHRPRMPWMLIEERFDGTSPEEALLPALWDRVDELENRLERFPFGVSRRAVDLGERGARRVVRSGRRLAARIRRHP